MALFTLNRNVNFSKIQRAMAEETVDKAIKEFDLTPQRSCVSRKLPLHGSYEWTPTFSKDLACEFNLPENVCHILVRRYGDQARSIIEMGKTGDLLYM